MALRSCIVTCEDVNGVQHSVEVTADSLYEAVGPALAAFRVDEWAGDLAQGLGTVHIAVRQPAVEHTVPVKKFRDWLAGTRAGPREHLLKERLRGMIGKID